MRVVHDPVVRPAEMSATPSVDVPLGEVRYRLAVPQVDGFAVVGYVSHSVAAFIVQSRLHSTAPQVVDVSESIVAPLAALVASPTLAEAVSAMVPGGYDGNVVLSDNTNRYETSGQSHAVNVHQHNSG